MENRNRNRNRKRQIKHEATKPKPPIYKNPYFTWILSFGTGGFYIFIWALLVAMDLNKTEKRIVIPIQLFGANFLIIFMLAYESIKLYIVYRKEILVVVPSILLAVFIIYIQLVIGHYIKSKFNNLGIKPGYSHIASVLLFWFVASSGTAYMQYSLNRIANYNQKTSRISRISDLDLSLKLATVAAYVQLTASLIVLIFEVLVGVPTL